MARSALNKVRAGVLIEGFEDATEWTNTGSSAADHAVTDIDGNQRTTQEKVTISLGVADYDPKKHKTMTDFFEDADNALYIAKNKGRNQVRGKIKIENKLPDQTKLPDSQESYPPQTELRLEH